MIGQKLHRVKGVKKGFSGGLSSSGKDLILEWKCISLAYRNGDWTLGK